MITQALNRGQLKKGDTVVEGSSGNTGQALAYVAKEKGLKARIYAPDKISPQKKARLEEFGAEVIISDDFVDEAKRDGLLPGFWHAHQHANPDNPAAHITTTAVELQKEGFHPHNTIIVACIGTGGTATGLYMAGYNIIGVQPYGSIFDRPHLDTVETTWKVEGFGQKKWYPNFTKHLAKRINIATFTDSMIFERYDNHPLPIGPSACAASLAAEQFTTGNMRPLIIVPDSRQLYQQTPPVKSGTPHESAKRNWVRGPFMESFNISPSKTNTEAKQLLKVKQLLCPNRKQK